MPLIFHPDNTRLSHLRKVSSAAEILKVYAVSRLMLDNFTHVKALWMYLGLKFTGVVLRFGADDMGGTSFDERIVHAAGSDAAVVSKGYAGASDTFHGPYVPVRWIQITG